MAIKNNRKKQGECTKQMMKFHKRIAAVFMAAAMAAAASLSAMAVTPGYSDYGTSDKKPVTAGQEVGDLTAPDSGVTVNIPADVLPEGVTEVSMGVVAKDSSAFEAAISQAAGLGYEDVTVLDIVLFDQDGNKITQLNGMVEVTVPASGNQNAVLYIDDNQDVSDMKASLNNRYLTFKTNHFSHYAAATLTEKAAGSDTENPATGDSSAATMAVFGVMSVAAAGIIFASIKARKASQK